MATRVAAGTPVRPRELRSPRVSEAWRFGPASEADFEPLLALRIEVMREHHERVFRYKPSRARRIFREHFDEPGMRLILLAEADALNKPVRLEVLTGSQADRFYLRHGFVLLRQDDIEAEDERPFLSSRA
jgi:hypothetical protein